MGVTTHTIKKERARQMNRNTRITPQLDRKAEQASQATRNTFCLKDGFNCIIVYEYNALMELYDVREFPEYTTTAALRRQVHHWLDTRIADADYWHTVNQEALRQFYGQPTLTILR